MTIIALTQTGGLYTRSEHGWQIRTSDIKSPRWVSMPKNPVGVVLYEHDTTYISEVDGVRRMIRKKDGYVFPNANETSVVDREQFIKLGLKRTRAKTPSQAILNANRVTLYTAVGNFRKDFQEAHEKELEVKKEFGKDQQIHDLDWVKFRK